MEKVATRPNAIGSMVNQLTQKKPAAADTDDKEEPSTAGPGAGAFGQMANQLSGNKPNTMANAPISASNKAKADNPNLTTSPAAQPVPGVETPAAPDVPAAAAEPTAEKPGLLQKIGKGFGDLATGFKQGYSGNYNLDGEDDEPAAAGTTPAAGDQQATSADIKPITFASIKPNIDKLDKKGKQRILAAVRKELGVVAPATSTVTPTATTPPAGGTSDVEKAGRTAAAKPGFQRTATDNLAIKAARQAGVKIESKKSVKKKTNLKESKGFQLPFSLFKK